MTMQPQPVAPVPVIPVLTRPSASDPRFPKPRGEQSPDERVRERLRANPLRCDRSGCSTKIHVQLPEDRREANALAHGFLRGEGQHNHLVYCSKRCRDMHAPAGLKAGDPCPKPHCMREGLAIDRCYCQPQLGGPGGQSQITRVTVRDTVDRQGVTHRAIICDRWGCQEKQYVDPSTSAERVCQIAFTAGFRQADHGTCCSAQCSRTMAADVRAGRQPPVNAATSVITTDRKAPEPAAPAAPEPKAAPQPRGEYGVWCYEQASYVATNQEPWSGDSQGAELRVAHLRQLAVEQGEVRTYAARAFASEAPPELPARNRKERRAAAAPKG